MGALAVAMLCANAWAGGQSCSSVRYPAPSGQHNDIVFTFAKPYDCGRFANGDWWVAADASGTVTLLAVAPEAGEGTNGLEVNPHSKSKQGFDRRISGYAAELTASLPLRIAPDASVVKAVSVSRAETKCRPCLQFAAVLTVVGSAVADSENMLRPGYFGGKKMYYRFPADRVGRLPSYGVTCCSEAKYGDFERIAKRFQGVQLDHLEGWVGGRMHPADNMPDYGASIAVDSATSLLRFLLDDFDITRKPHRLALISYLQTGVDLQAVASGGVNWPSAGGHGNGRKLPILFAGYVLGEVDFEHTVRHVSFSEDSQVYFSEKAGRALYGSQCTDAEYWMMARLGKGPRDCRDPYGYIDGGGQEIGAAYQVCCTAMPWKYTALAVRMLGLERQWGNDAFLEYVDRWVNDGVWASPDPCAPYNNVPEDYLKSYGPSPAGGCIRGAGRATARHQNNKDAGHYRSALGDQLWRTYRKQRPGKP